MDISTSIVYSVASSTGSSPLDLPPLSETIDPEVISKFTDSVSDEFATLTFSYCGHKVIIQGTGEVVVNKKCSQNLYN